MVRACISTSHSPARRWVYISHTVCMCIYRMYTLQGEGEGADCFHQQEPHTHSPG